MGDTTNVKIGVCSVTIDGTDIGHTLEGVEVIYAPEFADIKVDQYGNTPVDKVLIGETFSIRLKMAERTIANLKRAIMGATLAAADKITIGSDAGLRGTDFAKRIVLHPIANAAGERDDDVIIHKGVVTSEVALGYKVDEQSVIEIEITALIDESQSDGAYLGVFGDSTS